MVLCVGGIDTGAGKTFAAAFIYKWALSSGMDAITVKAVQTGNTGFSEDIEAHRRLAGVPRQPEDEAGLSAPQIFAFPASPAYAARREGRKVDLRAISNAVAECEKRRGTVIVEMAGGLLAPLSETVLSADYIAERKWPLVLVSCGRLGSINHTLLSLECAKNRGIKIAGVIWNGWPAPDPEIDADAKNEVRKYMVSAGWPATLVSLPVADSGALPQELPDFSPIFENAAAAQRRS